MSNEAVGTLIGLAVFLALRIVDYVLPKGRHLRWIDRFTVPNEEDEEG